MATIIWLVLCSIVFITSVFCCIVPSEFYTIYEKEQIITCWTYETLKSTLRSLQSFTSSTCRKLRQHITEWCTNIHFIFFSIFYPIPHQNISKFLFTLFGQLRRKNRAFRYLCIVGVDTLIS